MAELNQIPVTVVQPGEGEYVALPGFGAVFKLSSRTNGGEVSIVEHPFEVGLLTAAHRHTREDEHSIVRRRDGHLVDVRQGGQRQVVRP